MSPRGQWQLWNREERVNRAWNRRSRSGNWNTQIMRSLNLFASCVTNMVEYGSAIIKCDKFSG